MENSVEKEPYKINQEIIKDEEKEKRRREIFTIFFGVISVFGFIISLGFLTSMVINGSITGRLIGSNEGNVYGLIIVVIISLIWSMQSLVWFKNSAFSGIISIIGFVVSAVFLANMVIRGNILGRVIGGYSGDFYGIIIIVVISLLWAIQNYIWYRKNKRKNVLFD
jgi:hypothetical protein